MKKEWIYVYVQLISLAVHLKLIQQCKSAILQLKKKINDTKELKQKQIQRSENQTMITNLWIGRDKLGGWD